MKKGSAPYALWLIPQREQAIVLQAVIDELAGYGNTPPFPVHATLCSGRIETDPRELMGPLTAFAAGQAPLALANIGLQQSDDFFRFFFIRLGGGLHPIFTEAQHAFPGVHLPVIGPHLSLMYSQPRENLDRNTLAQTFASKLPTAIYFEEMQLVVPETGNWRDIGAWKTVFSRPLGRSSVP